MKNTTNKRDWVTRVAAKVTHFYDREYCGYLTPSEIIGLYDSGYIKQNPGSSLEQLDWIRAKRAAGNSSPNWHYFLIAKNTPFAEAVAARIKNKRG